MRTKVAPFAITSNVPTPNRPSRRGTPRTQHLPLLLPETLGPSPSERPNRGLRPRTTARGPTTAAAVDRGHEVVAASRPAERNSRSNHATHIPVTLLSARAPKTAATGSTASSTTLRNSKEIGWNRLRSSADDPLVTNGQRSKQTPQQPTLRDTRHRMIRPAPEVLAAVAARLREKARAKERRERTNFAETSSKLANALAARHAGSGQPLPTTRDRG